MTRHLTILVLLAGTLAVSPAAADTAEEALAKDAETARSASAPMAAKMKPLVASDARVAPLLAEIKRARAIRDPAARKAQLDALGPRILAVRNDIARKAGFDADTARRLAPLAGGLVRKLPTPVTLAGMKLGETTITSFPKTFSFKHRCQDADDKWDFDGSLVKVRAASAIGDADCWTLMAGRGAVMKIPAGTKKLAIRVSATVDLAVFACSLGASGRAGGYFGVRVHLPQGAFATVNGTTLTSTVHKLVNVYTNNTFPNPLPFTADGFADNIQEGDVGSTVNVDLPANPGSEVEVSIMTGGWVDADLQGVASLSNDLTPKSMKVSFYN